MQITNENVVKIFADINSFPYLSNMVYFYGKNRQELAMKSIVQFLNILPSPSSIYRITAHDFLNEFLNAITKNKLKYFRQKYDNLDVLLIEDIDYLFGKKQTQQELYFRINGLLQKDKYVIFTSERHLKTYHGIIEQIEALCSGGLSLDATINYK